MAFFPGPLTAAIVAGLSGRHGGRKSSPRLGAAGGIVFALSSLWFLARLDDQPQYLSDYLPGAIVGGIGVGLVLPALTALATGTLPPERLATGIGVQTTFRQIGAALGLASFVAIAGSSTLATKSDFDGAWLFMSLASAGAGIALAPLFRPQGKQHSRPVVPQPSASAVRGNPRASRSSELTDPGRTRRRPRFRGWGQAISSRNQETGEGDGTRNARASGRDSCDCRRTPAPRPTLRGREVVPVDSTQAG